MDKEAKLQNPIAIKVESNGSVSIINEDNNETTMIPNGVMLGTIHYGFIIISDFKGSQREVVIPTINRVDAIGVSPSEITVYEDGIRESWKFNKKGSLLRAMPDNPIRLDFTMTEKALEHSTQLLGEYRVSNPITIFIGGIKEERKIIFDDNEEYPLNPGVMIGGEHYGFVLIREVRGRQVERVFPTQNSIQAVGVSSKEEDTSFDVFEEGKHLSWKFDKRGKLIREASYLDVNTEDIRYVNEQINKKSLKV